MRTISKPLISLSTTQLIETALRNNEGQLAANGALVVSTGKFTGRSPQDKFIVDDETTHGLIDWGKVNQPITPARFDALCERVTDYIDSLPAVYVKDAKACADQAHRLNVRVISEYAWHSLFADQLLIAYADGEAIGDPDLTIIDAANFQAEPERDGTRSSTFIIMDMTRKIVLIGGTQYAGEIKKSVFSALNFLLPGKSVLPMHCSANIGGDGRTALFFGLSGTGKTTLSADPERALIGDDEHGWSADGVFNFEGGCYAKCIDLTRQKEPEIWDAIRFGTVLENVALTQPGRVPIYSDKSMTENSRAAYPLDYIPHSVLPSVGGHPSCVIFLCADAFGVLPPISRLTPDQAMYYFLSGYTAKLAGTERGVTTPQSTFSSCFGAPFLPLHPVVYAEMLGERLERHAASCYLVNTGWCGGPYGIGKRIDLALTRAIVSAALSGALDHMETRQEPVFGLHIPVKIDGVPDSILTPRDSWADGAAYDRQATELAHLFVENFTRFSAVSPNIKAAGPLAAEPA